MPFFNKTSADGTEAKQLSPETGKMLDVIIALIPAALAGIAVFGIRAALLIAVTVISSVLFEHLYCVIRKSPATVGDLSAVITGLVLAFSLPVRAPIYVPVFGSAVAIILVKLLSGGKGKNFLNPAITARAALYIAFTPSLVKFTVPARNPVDAVSCATPMRVLSQLDMSGNIGEQIAELSEKGELPGLINMLFGVKAGCIGEVCAIALLLGGIYLILRGVISFALPVSYLGAFTLCTFVFSGFSPLFTLYYLLSGAVLLGAFFILTDPVTSPDTLNKQLIFGTAAGTITALIRFFTPLPEGVTVAVLLMNIAVLAVNKFPVIKAWLSERKKTKESSEAPETESPTAEEGSPLPPEESSPSAEPPSEAENEPSPVGEGSPLPPEEISPSADRSSEIVGDDNPGVPSEEVISSAEIPSEAENESSLVGDGVPDIPSEEISPSAEIPSAPEAPPATPVSKPVLVNELTPDTDSAPVTYTDRKKKPGRKNKKKMKQMPDFSEPLPEVIPEFLKREIEKQNSQKGE